MNWFFQPIPAAGQQDEAAAGGVTHNVSVAETGAATDTLTAANTTSAALTETGGATDTLTAGVTMPVSISETGAATDTQDAIFVLPVDLTETGAATDAYSENALASVVSFRWRNDDGSEAAATWKHAENVDLADNPALDVNIRLRHGIENNGSVTLTNVYELFYRVNGGAWLRVDNFSSAYARYAVSSNFAHQAATTDQLTTPTGTFIAGTMRESTPSASIAITAGNNTEIESCFRFRSADISDGDVIDFGLSIDPGELIGVSNDVIASVVLRINKVTETGSAADTQTAANTTSAAVAETGASTDTITAVVVFAVDLTEAASGLDTITAANTTAVVIAETGAANDNVEGTIAAPPGDTPVFKFVRRHGRRIRARRAA